MMSCLFECLGRGGWGGTNVNCLGGGGGEGGGDDGGRFCKSVPYSLRGARGGVSQTAHVCGRQLFPAV